MRNAGISFERFESLCKAQSYAERFDTTEQGIGIYNEKRLHKILKQTLCDNEENFEVKVGKYVADLLCDGVITEIQCGSFVPMQKKLEYYLQNTDCEISIIHPIISDKKIIRAERETGEILRVRQSPKRENIFDAIAALYPIKDFLLEKRISVTVVMISVEEYRYSERMRHRKKGAYDAEVFPIKMLDAIKLCNLDGYRTVLPEGLEKKEYSAAKLSEHLSLTGRKLYSALNTLSAVGVFERVKDGRNLKYLLK